MVSLNNQSSKEKPVDRSDCPEPAPFREPEGLMNVELNCGDNNIPDLKRKTFSNYHYSSTKKINKKLKVSILLSYLIGFISLGVFSFLIAVLINKEYNFYHVEPIKYHYVEDKYNYTIEPEMLVGAANTKMKNNHRTSRNKEKRKETTDISKINGSSSIGHKINKTHDPTKFFKAIGHNDWMKHDIEKLSNNSHKNINIIEKEGKVEIFVDPKVKTKEEIQQAKKNFKEKVKENSNFLPEFAEKLALCKITENLKDCCDLFSNSSLYDLAHLCSVNDVLDLLMEYESNVNLRTKREIDEYDEQTHEYLQNTGYFQQPEHSQNHDYPQNHKYFQNSPYSENSKYQESPKNMFYPDTQPPMYPDINTQNSEHALYSNFHEQYHENQNYHYNDQNINNGFHEPSLPTYGNINNEYHEPQLPTNQNINNEFYEPELPTYQNINNGFHEPSLPTYRNMNNEYHEPQLPTNQNINNEFYEPELPTYQNLNNGFHESSLPIDQSINSEFYESHLPQNINNGYREPALPTNQNIHNEYHEPAYQNTNNRFHESKLSTDEGINGGFYEPVLSTNQNIHKEYHEPALPTYTDQSINYGFYDIGLPTNQNVNGYHEPQLPNDQNENNYLEITEPLLPHPGTNEALVYDKYINTQVPTTATNKIDLQDGIVLEDNGKSSEVRNPFEKNSEEIIPETDQDEFDQKLQSADIRPLQNSEQLPLNKSVLEGEDKVLATSNNFTNFNELTNSTEKLSSNDETEFQLITQKVNTTTDSHDNVLSMISENEKDAKNDIIPKDHLVDMSNNETRQDNLNNIEQGNITTSTNEERQERIVNMNSDEERTKNILPQPINSTLKPDQNSKFDKKNTSFIPKDIQDCLGINCQNLLTSNPTQKTESTISTEKNVDSRNKTMRINQDSQHTLRQKQKVDSFLSTSEDIQTNQQMMLNPCFNQYTSAFNNPYRGAQQFYDGSQVLKVVPVNQQKVMHPMQQQGMYMVNPLMYSYFPPQSPYMQNFAPPMAAYNPYAGAVQASGANGQYYMCNPVPAPSNTNIASMSGVEVRGQQRDSSYLQDMIQKLPSSLKTRNNKTRESLLCPVGEQSCDDDSKCLKIQQFCDNEVHCADGSDEINCTCKDRVGNIRLCDGFFDCPNGEDEEECFGCNANEFSCDDWSRFRRSTCVPMEHRCDGVRQCEVTGKDEEDCSLLADHIGNHVQFKISNAVGFLHRNYRGKWFPTCVGTDVWAMDVCKVESGPSIIAPRSHMMLTTDNYDGKFINILQNNAVNLVNSCVQHRAAFVECPPLYCGLRIIINNPYREQEVDTDVEEVLDNMEQSNRESLLDIWDDDGRIGKKERLNKDSDNRDLLGISRVVGGKPSQPAAWPWIVSIYKNGIFHCGGVIINELWIVTAAHCVDRYWLYYYEIHAGALRRFSFSPMEQTRWASVAIAHEDYDKSTLNNDIALIKLSGPIRYNRYVRPICLPSESTAGRDYLQGPAPGTICTAVGWGATLEHGSDPDHMREVELPVLATCKSPEDRQGDEICAGLSEGGKDACQGDSGGPFMCRNPNNPSQWYLAGIVSHGEGCARPNEPGVYTKVSKYINWIAENTREDKFIPKFPLVSCPGFTCLGTRRCLPSKRRCDKIVDCLFGDDEQNCGLNFQHFFKRKSISRDMHLLVGAPNVENMEIVSENNPEFAEAKKVDGVEVKNNISADQYFKCKRMLQIISISKRCDKVFDCEDGTDELDCLCIDYIRNHNPEAICDGVTDCFDGSDEKDCVKCESEEFYCRYSQRCIDMSQRCDGVSDCDKNEDEWDCVTLTNGIALSLTSDSRPKLYSNGIITVNRNGIWRPLCVNATVGDASFAAKVCNSLGFDDYTSFHKYQVKNNSLQVIFEGLTQQKITPLKPSPTCGGLFVSCSNVSLDSMVHGLYGGDSSDVELYTAPWNAAIFSDGHYKCMGTILNRNWVITSLNCFNGIAKLQNHYVAVLLGKGKTNLAILGPHEQTLRVIETVHINDSDVTLLRMDSDIVFDRYVKPAHLEARRDENVNKEKCVAIGFEEEKPKYVSMKSVKNCPTKMRCFESKIVTDCDRSMPWSGTVVCDSRNGWYPASVFDVDGGSCGLSKFRQFTDIMAIKNKIKEAMAQPKFVEVAPKCGGFRCTLGKCLDSIKVCDGIPDCRNGEDENPDLCFDKSNSCHLTGDCVCPVSHMQCPSNKCVPKTAFCDRKNDCGNFEDEPDVCSCRSYLLLTRPEKLCDGIVNCLDRTDEDPELCFCRSDGVKCGQSNLCVSKEMVCDGARDCPNGEDESVCYSMKFQSESVSNKGEVLTRTAGIWHSGCFDRNLTTTELEDICFELGFTGAGSKQLPFPEANQTSPLRPVMDPFQVVWIHRETGNKLKLKLRTGHDPYVTFLPDSDCNRLFIECV